MVNAVTSPIQEENLEPTTTLSAQDRAMVTRRNDITARDEEGLNAGMSTDQVLNAVAGINNFKIGIQQVIAEGSEFLGFASGGSAEVFTQEAKKDRELLDQQRAQAIDRTGAGVAEFGGETLFNKIDRLGIGVDS